MNTTKISDARIQRSLGFRVKPDTERGAVRHKPISFQIARVSIWSKIADLIGRMFF